MASNRRSREARLLEPLLARRPNELPDNALGPTINDLYQSIAAHKVGHDHDWIYFTKDEITNMWLGAYNPNIVIPAIPGAGVLFDGNIVKIDSARDYSWQGNHTFSAPIVGTISNATDADKLDGSHASAFAVSGHNHDTAYLGKTATAADSDKVDGYHASSLYGTHNPQFIPCSSLIYVIDNLSMTAGQTLNVQLSSYGIPSTCRGVFVHTQGVWASTTGVLVLSKYNTTDLDLVCRPQVANVRIHNSGLVRVGSGYFNVQNKTYAGSITVIIVGYVM